MPSTTFTTVSGGGSALVPGLWVSWDGTLTWGGDYDNLTEYVIHARYTRGSSPEITGAAQAGSAVFTVKNPDGLFDPDNAAGPLYGLLHDGIPIWWGVNDDGTINDKGAVVRGRFAGRITEVAPLPMAGAGDSTPTAEIVCEDALGWYARIYVHLDDDCGPAAEAAVEQYFTHTHLGGCEPGTWDQLPGTGNLMAGFLVQRDDGPYDASNVPIGNTVSGDCNAATDIPGTEWTWADGIGSGGTSAKLSLAWRMSGVGESQFERWAGAIGGTGRPRSFQIEIAGLTGAPAVTASVYNPTTSGLVFTSPDIVATGAGYILAVLAYRANGPAETLGGFSYSITPRAPAVDLPTMKGFAFGGFGPYSMFTYLKVEAAGTYNIIADCDASPHENPGYANAWEMGFWPS